MVARLSITPATIYQGFLSAAVGPRGSPRSRNSGKTARAATAALTSHQSSETFLAGAPPKVGRGQTAAQATAKPGCRGVGQAFRGSRAPGRTTWRTSGHRAAPGPRPPWAPISSPVRLHPWLTSPTPRSGADKPPGPPWLALPPARYARPRVGPGGHAGGGHCRTPAPPQGAGR